MQQLKKITIPDLQNWIEENRSRMIEDYFTFLKFPSVSSEPSHKQDMLNCAQWLREYLEKLGFQVETWQTSGHPVLFASLLTAGEEKPTLLIYNHYDVQPIDPIEEWLSPPFQPTLGNGEVYARGAQDNKGQCFFVLQALKYLIEKQGSLPINIKLCIEGEEEMGSTGLNGILQEKKEELKADYLAIVDTGIRKSDIPAITLGMRGIVTFDVEIQGSHTDLHSGSHGGIVANPIHALVHLLDQLRDATGKVTIPGFYDAVLDFSKEEKEKLSLQFNEAEYLSQTGAEPVGGEVNHSPSERAWLRPTLEINGINGGYSGMGFKTVIPAKATAKLSCRLVPDQNPAKIGKLVAAFLKEKAPKGVQVTVHIHPGDGKAIRVSPESPLVTCFAQAFQEVFKAPCEFIFGGGSIPIATQLAETSESKVILLGLGLDTDRIHAPNEHFGLDRIEKGLMIMARAIELLGGYRVR